MATGVADVFEIDGSWQIRVSDRAGTAGQIAAEELRAYFAGLGLSLPVVADDGPAAGRCVRLLVASDDRRDMFHLSLDGASVRVEGSNGRSVLYGTYRLIDWLRGDRETDELDVRETAYFVERWMPPTIHGRSDDERNFRCLARLGVNTSYLRGRRDAGLEVKHFHHYVRDDRHLPQISRDCPPVEEVRAMALGACRLARRFGMDAVMFQDEPVAVAGPASTSSEVPGALPAALLDELPADALGTAHRLAYRRDGWKALSVFHPTVEAHYAELIGQVLDQFEGVRTLYLYNEDAAAANVWPPAEPYAKDAYPRGYDGYPYAAHLHLVRLLQDAGRARRPDFRVATIAFHWYQPPELRQTMIAGLPPHSVLIALGAWDDSVDTTRLPDWSQDFCRLARARGDVVLLADDDFNATSDDLLMEITAGFPIPLRTYRKCAAWAAAGAVGVTQHHTGGPSLGVNSINDLAWREFTWRPLVGVAEAEAKVFALLRRQLHNEPAARAMLEGCHAVDRGLDAVEADVDHRPYASRLEHSARIAFPPHLEQGLHRPGESTADYCGDGIDPAVWHRMLLTETAAYAEALSHARRACALSPADRSSFHLPCPTDAPVSCRDYASVMADAIEIVLRFKRTFLNFLDAETSRGADQVATWQRERQNVRDLVPALRRRERWMQSPYGLRVLHRYLGLLGQKLQRLDRHLGGSASAQ